MTDAARQPLNGGVRSGKKNEAALNASDPKNAIEMSIPKFLLSDDPVASLGAASPQVKQTFSPFVSMALHAKQRVIVH